MLSAEEIKASQIKVRYEPAGSDIVPLILDTVDPRTVQWELRKNCPESIWLMLPIKLRRHLQHHARRRVRWKIKAMRKSYKLGQILAGTLAEYTLQRMREESMWRKILPPQLLDPSHSS